VRPCLIHTCHAIPITGSDHDHFSQGHGTAWPSRYDLWAPCLHLVSSGYHAEFHEDCYQKHTNPPHNDPHLQLSSVVAAHYKKDNLLHCWTSSSDIFRLPRGLSQRTQHCRSTVGARHGHGMLCVNRPLLPFYCMTPCYKCISVLEEHTASICHTLKNTWCHNPQDHINPLKTKTYLCYIRTQRVLHSKDTLSRL